MSLEKTLSAAGLAVAYVAALSGTWTLFEKTQSAASDEANDRVRNWLRGVNPSGASQRLASLFAGAFDSVFGEHLISWRTFGRSCIASAVCIIITFAIWVFLRPAEFHGLMADPDIGSDVATVVVFAGICNLLPDYISLLKARWFISQLERGKALSIALAVVVADALCSALIGLTAWVFLNGLFGWLTFTQPIEKSLADFLHFVLPLKAQYSGNPPYGLWFYASMFTSGWLWIWCLSAVIIRLGHLLDSSKLLLTKFTNIEEAPFLSLAVASTVLETVVFIPLCLRVFL